MTLHQEHFTHGCQSNRYPQAFTPGTTVRTVTGLDLTLFTDTATEGVRPSGFVSRSGKKSGRELVVGDMSTLRVDFGCVVERVWLDYRVVTDFTEDDIEVEGLQGLDIIGSSLRSCHFPDFFAIRFLAHPRHTNAAKLSRMSLEAGQFRAIELETNRAGRVHIESIAWETATKH